jgi:hypothetical protein
MVSPPKLFPTPLHESNIMSLLYHMWIHTGIDPSGRFGMHSWHRISIFLRDQFSSAGAPSLPFVEFFTGIRSEAIRLIGRGRHGMIKPIDKCLTNCSGRAA